MGSTKNMIKYWYQLEFFSPFWQLKKRIRTCLLLIATSVGIQEKYR